MSGPVRLIGGPLMTAVAAIWLATGLFDAAPAVSESGGRQVHASATILPTHSEPLVLDPDDLVEETSEADDRAMLDAELAEALSEIDRVRSRAIIGENGLDVAITTVMPDDSDMLGRYVNVRLTVRPEDTGIAVTRMAIGRYRIPGRLIAPALGLWRGWLPGADDAMTMLTRIERIDPVRRTVTLAPQGTAHTRHDPRG